VSFRHVDGFDVDGAVRDGPLVRLLARDGGATVADLVRRGVPLDDLEVRPATLEEALERLEGGR
jgi:hypothetical protein